MRDQAKMVGFNGSLTKLEMDVIKKMMMNENSETNEPYISNHHDDQDEATENEREDLVNVFQNNVTLSFGNVERIQR